MTAISVKHSRVTDLLKYHRDVASDAIAQIKEGTHTKSVSQAQRALREFRRHAKDLRNELESIQAELDSTDQWVESEYQKSVESVLSPRRVVT